MIKIFLHAQQSRVGADGTASGLSYTALSQYRSSIRHLFEEKGVGWSEDLQKGLSQYFQGLKRLCARDKRERRSGPPRQEGMAGRPVER